MVQRGSPIDCVGLQMHITANVDNASATAIAVNVRRLTGSDCE